MSLPFDPLDEFLRLVALPAGICAAAALLGRIAFPRSGRVRDAILALAVGAAFAAALVALGRRPSFPLAASDDGWLWVVWVAPGAAVVGAAGAFVRAREAVRVVAWAALAAGAAWLVAMPLVHAGTLARGEALARAAGGGAIGAAIASAVAWRARAPAGFPSALPLLVALSGTAYALADPAGSLLLGEAAGALAAAIGGAALFSRPRAGPALPVAVAPVVAAVAVGLLASARTYLDDTFPLGAALLFAAACGAVAVRPWWAASGLSVLLAAAGVYVTTVSQPPPGPW